jgi:hypothetical protein
MKQNLLLHFAEMPESTSEHEEGTLEYSNDLNLTIVKGSNIPAVAFIDQATETFTKANGEGSDSDAELSKKLEIMMGTSTNTYNTKERSDSDRDVKSIQELMATQTLTERIEATDSDK